MNSPSMVKAHIGSVKGKKLFYELNSLTRHAVVLGTTGSGKTVMGKVLMEEAMQKGIPILAIDPKGDLGGLSVSDPDFDFIIFICFVCSVPGRTEKSGY